MFLWICQRNTVVMRILLDRDGKRDWVMKTWMDDVVYYFSLFIDRYTFELCAQFCRGHLPLFALRLS